MPEGGAAMLSLIFDAALEMVRLRRSLRVEARTLPHLDDHLRQDMGLPPRVAVPARLVCAPWT